MAVSEEIGRVNYSGQAPGDKTMPSSVTGLTVLQVIPRLKSGGAERSTLEIVNALVAAGARGLVASEGGRLAADVTAAGGRLIILPLNTKNPIQMIANALALARIARREAVSLIHARSRAPAWSAWIAAKLAGVPFVTTYHGVYRARGPLKRWYNGIMAKGARVIANSAFTANHVATVYPAVRGRLVTIPRGVDLALFDPGRLTPEQKGALRAAWSLPEGKRLILVPGRLTPWKGQEQVIEAVGLLRSQGKAEDVLVVLVGDIQSARYRHALEARLRSLGLEGIVRIVGHFANMPLAYGVADVVVQASTAPEAFGRVAVEAQAMGAIVVASAIGGASETVCTGPKATGFLVKPGEVEALAWALERALSLSLEDKAAMSARARAHIAARFSLTRMCADTLAVYAGLCEGAGARGGRNAG